MKDDKQVLNPSRALSDEITHAQLTAVGRFPRRCADVLKDTGRFVAANPYQRTVAINLMQRCKDGQLSIMLGPPGCGKTMIATGIAWHWFQYRWTLVHGKPLYITLSKLMRTTKDSFGRPSGKSPLTLAEECGLFVLDELTTQNDSIYDQRELRDLIDNRYQDKLPTMLITNQSLSNLNSLLDQPTIDRALEGNGGLVEFNPNAKSLRQ